MMSTNLYKEIVETISAQTRLRECQNALETRYPTVSPLTLGSILSSHVQRKMKWTYSKHNTPEKATEYYELFLKAVESNESPGIILRIADKVEICPVLIARVILEGYFRDFQEKEIQKYKDKTKNSNEITEKSNIQSQAIIRSEVTRLIRDTSTIENRELAYEVYLCTVHDDHYGPMPELIKQTIGQEYEQILKDKLTELNVAFVDEGIMRKEGYDKTPDFKLEIPIGIGGRVVNWIESKALFGDEDTHQTYLDEQLMSYWNRFGPGLVIYWLGYCESIESITIPGILISDHLPASIEHLNPIIPSRK